MRRGAALLLLFLLGAAALRASDDDLPAFRIDPGDALQAAARASGPDRGLLHIVMTRAKAAEFAQFTGGHIGDQVRIVVCDELVCRPVVKAPVPGPDLDILYPSKNEAARAAKLLAATPGKEGQATFFPPPASAPPPALPLSSP